MKTTSLLLTTITFTLMGFVLSGQPTQAVGVVSLSDPAIKQYVGETLGDRVGDAISSAGDVNGDGYGDLLIGVSGHDKNFSGGTSSNIGATYLVYGPVADLNNVTLSAANTVKFSGESSNDEFGGAVASAGDVNGDGFSDILIGAIGDDDGGSSAGAVYLIYGQATPLTDMAVTLDNTVKFIGEASLDYAGYAVSSAGDVDGDTFDDIVIGALGNDDEAGAGYLVYGQSMPLSDTDLGADTVIKLTGEAAEDIAGFAVSSAGDVDGDGFADFLIGAEGNDAGASSAGAAYLIYGRAADLTDITLSADTAVKFTGETEDDFAGHSVSSAGDVNADGFADFLIGAPLNGDLDEGAAYLVYGQATDLTDTLLSDTAKSSKFICEADDCYAGEAVAAAGDYNADGFDDLLIGANFNSIGGYSRDSDDTFTAEGATYLVLGQSATLSDLTLSATTAIKYTGEADHDTAGVWVSSAGDVDADGLSDLLIGAANNDTGGSSAGAVYLVISDATDPVTDNNDTITDNTGTDTGETGAGDTDSGDTGSGDTNDGTDTGGDNTTDDTRLIVDVTKADAILTVLFDDASTVSFEPFGNDSEYEYSFTADTQRIVVTNGKLVRVFLADTKVAQKKINGKKLKDKFTTLKVKQLYTDKSYDDVLVVLAKPNNKAKVVHLRLTANHQLKKFKSKSFTIHQRQPQKVKIKAAKHRFTTSVGKKAKLEKVIWKVTKKGKLKIVQPI